MQSITIGGKDLGAQIIENAVTRARSKASDRMLDYTEELMTKVESTRKHLNALEGDLKAIEDGEFTVAGGTIVFNDSKRGQAFAFGPAVSACPRCGTKIGY